VVTWNKKKSMMDWNSKFRTFRHVAVETVDIRDASKRAIIRFWRRNRLAKLTAVSPPESGDKFPENRPLL